MALSLSLLHMFCKFEARKIDEVWMHLLVAFKRRRGRRVCNNNLSLMKTCKSSNEYSQTSSLFASKTENLTFEKSRKLKFKVLNGFRFEFNASAHTCQSAATHFVSKKVKICLSFLID